MLGGRLCKSSGGDAPRPDQVGVPGHLGSGLVGEGGGDGEPVLPGKGHPGLIRIVQVPVPAIYPVQLTGSTSKYSTVMWPHPPEMVVRGRLRSAPESGVSKKGVPGPRDGG